MISFLIFYVKDIKASSVRDVQGDNNTIPFRSHIFPLVLNHKSACWATPAERHWLGDHKIRYYA